MQTNKLDRFPLIAVGGEFWEKFMAFVGDTLLGEGTISPEDLQFLHRVETAEDVVRVIRHAGLRTAERA
jgi:predicted Rossmann-fold nucleotide-binding protein